MMGVEEQNEELKKENELLRRMLAMKWLGVSFPCIFIPHTPWSMPVIIVALYNYWLILINKQTNKKINMELSLFPNLKSWLRLRVGCDFWPRLCVGQALDLDSVSVQLSID